MRSTHISRREMLSASVAGLGLAAAAQTPRPQFKHRGYLGWITDLASKPEPKPLWPSMLIDEPLLEDYKRTFALMKKLGFNAAVIWGFYVSRDWPVDIASSVPRDRGKMVERLIDMAHAQGLRVYTGLGVYSWGFEQIIRANPKLSRNNPRAMCGSLPEAWEWMRKVTDFALTRFPVDGASLQSADQGRCDCEQCRRYGDTEYHARLDIRVSEYIRSKWPGKTLAVSGWGMDLSDPENLPHVVNLGRHIDYLIDVPDSTRKRDPAYRSKLIKALPCSFGTIGGPQVEPPQHWARDRWFLPTAKRQGEHLGGLYAEGGNACEYFFHILANPGDEVSFWVAGKQLSEPAVSWQTHLRATLDELYGVKSTANGDLMDLFVRAEDAYLKHRPFMRSGTIAMEPLIEGDFQSPVYLIKNLGREQRREYRQDIERIAAGFRKLAPDVPDKVRIEKIVRCLNSVQKDLNSLS